jgi:hypothetical protein
MIRANQAVRKGLGQTVFFSCEQILLQQRAPSGAALLRFRGELRRRNVFRVGIA